MNSIDRKVIMKDALDKIAAAVGAHLQPDGISNDECVNRVIEAVNNPRVCEALGVRACAPRHEVGASVASPVSEPAQTQNLSAQAKERATDDAELEALWANIWQWEESHSPDLEESLIALRDYLNESFAARLSQGAQGEAVAVVENKPWPQGVVPKYDRSCHIRALGNELLPDGTKLYTHPTERAAVPDGWGATIQEAIDCIADVAQFKGNLAVGTYRHIGSKLSALLTAAPQPPEGAP